MESYKNADWRLMMEKQHLSLQSQINELREEIQSLRAYNSALIEDNQELTQKYNKYWNLYQDYKGIAYDLGYTEKYENIQGLGQTLIGVIPVKKCECI